MLVPQLHNRRAAEAERDTDNRDGAITIEGPGGELVQVIPTHVRNPDRIYVVGVVANTVATLGNEILVLEGDVAGFGIGYGFESHRLAGARLIEASGVFDVTRGDNDSFHVEGRATPHDVRLEAGPGAGRTIEISGVPAAEVSLSLDAGAVCREPRPAPTAPTPAAAAAAGPVVALDPGTAPRVVVRYPDALAWRGHDSNQGSTFSSVAERVERTLHGTLTRTTPGRASGDLFTGTTLSLPPESATRTMFVKRVAPDLAAELPARLDLTIDPSGFTFDPIEEQQRYERHNNYREALLDALPQALPAEAVAPAPAGRRSWSTPRKDPASPRPGTCAPSTIRG